MGKFNGVSWFVMIVVGLLVCWVPHGVCAEDPPTWTLAGYGVASLSSDTGYDPGLGIHAEGSARWKFLELWAYGRYERQHKKQAATGYTYGYGVQGRGYVYGPWYVSASSSWAGYKSKFPSGTVWEKKGNNQGFGIGFNNYNTDVGLSYFLQEHQSPNKVQYVGLNVRQRLYEFVWLMVSFNRQTWDQVVSGKTERWSGYTGTIGIGLRW